MFKAQSKGDYTFKKLLWRSENSNIENKEKYVCLFLFLDIV